MEALVDGYCTLHLAQGSGLVSSVMFLMFEEHAHMLSLQDVMQTVYNSGAVEMTPILRLQNFLSMCKYRYRGENESEQSSMIPSPSTGSVSVHRWSARHQHLTHLHTHASTML